MKSFSEIDESQIASGVHSLEGNRWRWTSGQAAVLLKRPAQPARLAIRFVVPAAKPRSSKI